MKTHHWLAAAVIVLAALSAAQAVYLYQLGKEVTSLRAEGGERSAKVRSERPYLPPARTPATLASRLADPWDDPFLASGRSAWDPFEEMDQIQMMMNRMFRDSLSRGSVGSSPRGLAHPYVPDIDVREAGDAYVVRLDLPGIDKDKISVKVQNNLLTVTGERLSEKEEDGGQGGYYRMERSFGSFARSFPLPADADANNMTAESKNGVLTIRLPKVQDSVSSEKKVEIR